MVLVRSIYLDQFSYVDIIKAITLRPKYNPETMGILRIITRHSTSTNRIGVILFQICLQIVQRFINMV